MMLNSVVLPAPFGPITLQISPAVTLRLTSATALQAAEILADVFDRKQRGHDSHLLRRL